MGVSEYLAAFYITCLFGWFLLFEGMRQMLGGIYAGIYVLVLFVRYLRPGGGTSERAMVYVVVSSVGWLVGVGLAAWELEIPTHSLLTLVWVR